MYILTDGLHSLYISGRFQIKGSQLIEYDAQHHCWNQKQGINNGNDDDNATEGEEYLNDVHHDGRQYFVHLAHVLGEAIQNATGRIRVEEIHGSA